MGVRIKLDGKIISASSQHGRFVEKLINQFAGLGCVGVGGDLYDDGTYNTVREVIIYLAGPEIGSIQIVYDDRGRPVWGNKHGFCGRQSYRVKLNYPAEYLVSISGYCGCYLNTYVVVKSLTLHNNIKQYGPYGKEEGCCFMTPLTAGKIVGFFGRVGERLDSIGVYIKPFQTTTPCVGPFGTTDGQQWDVGTYHAFGTTGGQQWDEGINHSFETTSGQQWDDGTYNALGTIGGQQWNDGTYNTIGGQQWDDGTYGMVRELILYSRSVIDSTQVVDNDPICLLF
ncbi:jacalin-related lectin 3-like [Cornus florida]|uniref:jacalin-related lectin 3-like n=1 Tax=Cornus florida TaxID=4283 RepID=UPI002899BB64|nr:jacalin-related lectin 3-like [Cornus florida]